MAFLYCAVSEDLNRRSFDRFGQTTLLKFGHAGDIDRILVRLNEGWRDGSGRLKSEPLALCRDWVLLGWWPSERLRHRVDERICDFLGRNCVVPKILPLIERQVRESGRTANLNGLTEIFLIDHETQARLGTRIRERALRDPVSVQALSEVLSRLSVFDGREGQVGGPGIESAMSNYERHGAPR